MFQLCVDGVVAITLDLTRLTFIDSTGLRAIVAAQELCREHGYEYLLTPGSLAAQRIFELTGLLDGVPFQEPRPWA